MCLYLTGKKDECLVCRKACRTLVLSKEVNQGLVLLHYINLWFA